MKNICFVKNIYIYIKNLYIHYKKKIRKLSNVNVNISYL